MIILIGALLLLGVLIGAAAQLPPAVTAVAGGAIALWLAGFAVREGLHRLHAKGAGR